MERRWCAITPWYGFTGVMVWWWCASRHGGMVLDARAFTPGASFEYRDLWTLLPGYRPDREGD